MTGGTGLDNNDAFLIQYTTAGGVQRLAVVALEADVAAAAQIAAVEVTDIAILSGGIADLAAANYSFIA